MFTAIWPPKDTYNKTSLNEARFIVCKRRRNTSSPVHMDASTISHLEEFFSDIGFPIDKHGLVQESYEFPLPQNVREAIALLPDREYESKDEIRHELIGVSFDDGIAKKDVDATELEEIDDKMDDEVPLDEFTQMGDEENHESV